MLSPVYTPAPLPWLPLPRRSARGRRKNFPARKTREEKAIAGFRYLFQRATEILQIPPRSHAGAVLWRVCSLGRDGKGLRERAAGFIRRLPRSSGGGRRAPAQPRTGTAASHASLGGAQRCAAELRRDHNSNDHNEGDGSHLTLPHPIPSHPGPSHPAGHLPAGGTGSAEGTAALWASGRAQPGCHSPRPGGMRGCKAARMREWIWDSTMRGYGAVRTQG